MALLVLRTHSKNELILAECFEFIYTLCSDVETYDAKNKKPIFTENSHKVASHFGIYTFERLNIIF